MKKTIFQLINTRNKYTNASFEINQNEDFTVLVEKVRQKTLKEYARSIPFLR